MPIAASFDCLLSVMDVVEFVSRDREAWSGNLLDSAAVLRDVRHRVVELRFASCPPKGEPL